MFTRYKLSKYNVLVEDGDNHLLYNQVSGALMKLNDRLDEFRKIGETTWCLGKFKRKLRKHKFLVPATQNELEEYQKFFGRYINEIKEKRLVVVVTGRCNANCFYCYEKDDGSPSDRMADMSPEVQEQLVRFVDHCAASSSTGQVTVTWYGGEPLLRFDIVRDLAIKLREACKKHDVVFANNIITNGIALTDKIIDQLIEIDCRNVQITIDGPAEFHDKRRPATGNRPSYDIIMKNLEAGYIKGLEIDVRSNIDDSNAEGYFEFLQELLDKGLNKRNEAGGLVCPAPAITRLSSGLAMKQEDFAKVANKAIDMLRGKTERYRFLHRMLPGCMKNFPCYYNVTPDGRLTKCIAHLFDDTETVGTIYDLNLAIEDIGVAPSPLEDPECVDCPYLPSCGGGCADRHESYDGQAAGCHMGGCGSCQVRSGCQVVSLPSPIPPPDNGHNGGCQTVRWNLEKAVVGLYHFLQSRGEVGCDKD